MGTSRKSMWNILATLRSGCITMRINPKDKLTCIANNKHIFKMKKYASICFLLLIAENVIAQNSIQGYYARFTAQFAPTVYDEVDVGLDTIIDAKNAYLRIQRKPNDCCHDYVVFTFFKMTNGEKIFAHETGYGTTATDDHTTNFYSYKNETWKRITKNVFPFPFSFKVFWISTKLPHKKFQKFKTHIELPKNGTNIVVNILPIDMADNDSVFPKEKDAIEYDEMFRYYGMEKRFWQLEYKWDAQNGKFIFSKKMKLKR